MAEKKPIIKVWFMKPTEAFYGLSEEERNDLEPKTVKKLEEVGGKRIFVGSPFWSNEEWALIGVEEFPDIEAVQELARFVWENNSRYFETKTYLCTRWSQEQ